MCFFSDCQLSVFNRSLLSAHLNNVNLVPFGLAIFHILWPQWIASCLPSQMGFFSSSSRITYIINKYYGRALWGLVYTTSILSPLNIFIANVISALFYFFSVPPRSTTTTTTKLSTRTHYGCPTEIKSLG